MSDNVCVGVRLRPLNARELAAGKESKSDARAVAWEADAASCSINSVAPAAAGGKGLEAPAAAKGERKFHYDFVFEPTASNEDLYSDLACPVVEGALAGYNGTVFAYGQTSSGKTHSMLGNDKDPGVTPRAVEHVMRVVKEGAGGREFMVRASYCEIYNEVIRDLLNVEGGEVRIREDDRGQTYMHSTEEIIHSAEDAMAVLERGQRVRSVGQTAMNETSSRSHTIFTLNIESMTKQMGMSTHHRRACLHLVDLAGSERAKSTQATGARLREGSHINKSLLTLGTIINRLSSASDGGTTHLPYRDSKLTRVLRDALGGNSRTAVLCAITPSPVHVEETLSTLNFATRAKNVTNRVSRNETVDYRALFKEASAELKVLRAQIADGTAGSDADPGDTLSTDTVALNVELERTREELLLMRERAEAAELDSERHQIKAAEKRDLTRALRTEISLLKAQLDEACGKHETLQLSLSQAFFNIEDARRNIQLSRKKGSRVLRAEEDLYGVSVKLAMFVPDEEFKTRADEAAARERYRDAALAPSSSEAKSGGSASVGSVSDDPGSPPPSPRSAARKRVKPTERPSLPARGGPGSRTFTSGMKHVPQLQRAKNLPLGAPSSPVSAVSATSTVPAGARLSRETSSSDRNGSGDSRGWKGSSSDGEPPIDTESLSPIPILNFDEAYASGVAAGHGAIGGLPRRDGELFPAKGDSETEEMQSPSTSGYLSTARRTLMKKKSQAGKALVSLSSFYGGSSDLQDTFAGGHKVSSPSRT